MRNEDKNVIREYNRQYYLKNKKRLKTKAKEYRENNKDKVKESYKRWYESDKTKKLSYMIEYTHGLKPIDVEILKEQQNNTCFICNNLFTKSPYIDHNHSTGGIRGLLCRQCNTLIGFAKDNINILQNAIEYLNYSKP